MTRRPEAYTLGPPGGSGWGGWWGAYGGGIRGGWGGAPLPEGRLAAVGCEAVLASPGWLD